jgi:hypothetical protein
MMLRRCWLGFLQSDLFFWRKLSRLRSLNRALRRSNQELLLARQEWLREREVGGKDSYWYARWRELHERPAYVMRDAELERARTEIIRLRAELAALRRNLMRLPSAEGVPRPRGDFKRDWEVFRRPRGFYSD